MTTLKYMSALSVDNEKHTEVKPVQHGHIYPHSQGKMARWIASRLDPFLSPSAILSF